MSRSRLHKLNARLLLGVVALLAASGCSSRFSPTRLARVFSPAPKPAAAAGQAGPAALAERPAGSPVNASSAAGTGSAAIASGPGSAVQRAMRMQSQGAFEPQRDDARLRALIAAVSAVPSNALLRLQLAQRYEGYGLADAAMDEYAALLGSVMPAHTTPEGLSLLASALLGVAGNGLRAGRAAEALELIKPAADDSTSADLHLQIGLLHDQLGNAAQAEAAYRSALRASPQSAAARNNLGYRLMQRGELLEAELHFRAAISAGAGSANARNNLGFLLTERGELVAAWEQFRAASADTATAHNNFAVALMNSGKLVESREQLTLALRERRGFAPALSNFTIVQQRIKSGHAAVAVAPAGTALPKAQGGVPQDVKVSKGP